MKAQRIGVKIGTTFRTRFSLGFDHTDYHLEAAVEAGEFSDTLNVRKIAPFEGGYVEVSATAEQTRVWPPGFACFDVRCTLDGEVVATENITIIVQTGVTGP